MDEIERSLSNAKSDEHEQSGKVGLSEKYIFTWK